VTEPQEPPPPGSPPPYSAAGSPGHGPPPGYPPVPPQGYPPYGYPGYGAPGYGPPGYGPPGYGPSGYGPPPGHLGWAITALVFFWPLAIAAFINYARVDRDYYRGDLAGAQRASGMVRKLGIIALVLGPCLVILYITVVLIALSNSGCGIDASC
jgi:hypothetical protein